MVTQSLSHIIHLVSTFFLKIFFLLIKKKKKNLFSSLVYCLHLLFYFLQHFPSLLPFFFTTTLYFTIILPPLFSLSYILTILLLILFFLNLILFLSFNLYFSHTKIVSTLSLSLSLSPLSFGEFLLFFISSH